MKKEIISKLILAAFAFAVIQVFAVNIGAQEFSTDPQNPTPLENAAITGSLMPDKDKKYYVTFYAGPGDIFFDVNISPKENNGAVFFWKVYRSSEDAVKDNAWCPDNLYLETEKKGSKCAVTSGDSKTRQVVLGFGATPNGAPVKITYAIKLSGDWKPISATTNTSSNDLSFRQTIYIDTFQQDKVNPKAASGSPNAPVTVFRGDNLNCDDNACGFRIGFYVFRSNGEGKLTINVRITNGSSSKIQPVTFEPGKRSTETVVNVPIHNGNNRVAIEVDPQNQLSETNETNNRFEVTVVLKP